jgi:hypothetical protein
MKRQKTKVVTMLVTARVSKFLTPAEGRREVRTLINNQSGFLCYGPDFEDVVTRAVSVRAAPRSTPKE